MKRGSILVSVALATALSLILTPQARADAYGITSIGAFDYTFQGLKISVPSGFFFAHTIRGSDLTITSEHADIVAMGPAVVQSPFCNWRIDFQLEDQDGHVYRTDRGPVASTCDRFSVDRLVTTPQTLPSYGKACAIFYVNGVERVRQCHFISKPS